MPRPESRPYHHPRLREALISSALVEIETVGAARLSLREISRRAGVSHAAPAHHFGDKRGIFTAIATEGFELLRRSTESYLEGPDALLHSGLAYIGFAARHRGHFEVMFSPHLYDTDDPDLQAARLGAFDVLFRAVELALGTDDADEVTGTSIAAWSAVHGFASLWLGGNFPPEMTGDPDAFAALVMAGLTAVGRIAGTQSKGGLPPMEQFGILPRP